MAKAITFFWVLFLMVAATGLYCIDATAETSTRRFLTTGNWYPQTSEELAPLLSQFFKNAAPTVQETPTPGPIRGIISPHAGLIYSGQCAANAYAHLESDKPDVTVDRVILLGVAHRGRFRGAAVSTFSANATPLGNIPVDTTITTQLATVELFRVDNDLMQYEHSIENQLPFVQRALKNQSYKIVPILLGHLEQKDVNKIAAAIKPFISPTTLVIASTDFTHYGQNFNYTPFGSNIKKRLTQLDMGMINHIRNMDSKSYFNYKRETGITMCGFLPVAVLMELFNDGRHGVLPTDYRKSGDRDGNYSFSVSYASMLIYLKKGKGGKKTMNTEKTAGTAPETQLVLNQEEQQTLLKIARTTLERYLDKESKPDRDQLEKSYALSDTLRTVTGVFVTLKKKGHLRGCIGTIIGREPLFMGVRENAVNAAVNDYRFSRVTLKELKELDIEISVMTPLQPITDYKKIRLGVDGVIIRQGRHQSVFLPQVAVETGWDLDQFLGRLCMKAGLPENSFKESPANGMEFHIFQAQVFGEK